jgi:hypothetical protein
MARTAVPYSNMVANSSLDDPAGTNLNPGAGNGHSIADALPEYTVLRIDNTAASEADITIVAGDNPPALAAGQGNLVIPVAATSVEWIGPVESGRFLQSDGTLLIDVEAGATGTITAFKVPRYT